MQRNRHAVGLGLWVWGCLDPEKLQGSINVVGVALAVRYEPDRWRKTLFFFQTEICSHEEEMCMIKKWTILHQKCCKVRWRNALVDVSCRLLPLSTAAGGENASRETTKSEREVFKLPHPGCWLFTVKSSAVTPKISPPTPNWFHGAKQAAASSDEGTRQSSDTTETSEIHQDQKKETNKRPGGEWLWGRGLRLHRQNPTLPDKVKHRPSISHEKIQQLQCWDAHPP